MPAIEFMDDGYPSSPTEHNTDSDILTPTTPLTPRSARLILKRRKRASEARYVKLSLRRAFLNRGSHSQGTSPEQIFTATLVSEGDFSPFDADSMRNPLSIGRNAEDEDPDNSSNMEGIFS